MKTQKTNAKAAIEEIASKHLFIETLEAQQSDSRDFHDCHVACIEDALMAAYEAGRAAANK
jgi:hypothetical protein